ncbi:MAG: hypothetical protein R3E79_28120 [Caldilineaceae bacterium]
MSKRTPPVEWYVAESDAEWQRLCLPPIPDQPPSFQHRLAVQRFLGSVALFLCLLAGVWWWRTNQEEVRQKEVEVRATMPLHQTPIAPAGDWLRRHGPAVNGEQKTGQNVTSLVYGLAAAPPLTVQGDQAWGRLVIYTEQGEPAYRQTHFYRRTAAGWQRTAPDAALWGAPRTVETPSFVYHFRQQDTPIVIAATTPIEALYTTLRRNVGLSGAPVGEKLMIEVSVTQPPGQAIPWRGAPTRILVPSPAVYRAPVALTDEDLLVQAVALPLLAHVLTQADEQYQLDWAWQPLVNGLRLWQVWDLDLPLAAWRETVVTWVYTDLPNARPDQTTVMPEQYTALCASHKLWLPSPTEMNIPLLCAEGVQENVFLSPWGWYAPLIRLDQLFVPLPSDNYLEEQDALRLASHPGRTVALATLIEYAVAAYGRERLPALVAGLGQHESWATLLPAVYGVSAAEFEAGWRAYLVDHYGVSLTK